jgi:hypothetical protein
MLLRADTTNYRRSSMLHYQERNTISKSKLKLGHDILTIWRSGLKNKNRLLTKNLKIKKNYALFKLLFYLIKIFVLPKI